MKSLALAPSPTAVSFASEELAVQHNALVNASFSLDTLETRLFVAMLRRIRRQDKCFVDYVIPVRELTPAGGIHAPYAEVAQMVKRMARQAVDIEPLDAAGRPQRAVSIQSIPLMSLVSYTKASGHVIARFNEEMRPYLLELTQTFTKAKIGQLLKLKSMHAYRIYWLLKEYEKLGQRTIMVAELRRKLKLTTKYVDRFDHFRTRVLDLAQQELAHTDLPFEYEVSYQGRNATQVRFILGQPVAAAAPQPPKAVPTTAWEQALLDVGVKAASLLAIKAKLAAGTYDEGYIRYVLARVDKEVQAGKIKKRAGAIFKALTDDYYLFDYQVKKVEVVTPGLGTKAINSPARTKLKHELVDAKNTLKWLREPNTLANIYKGEDDEQYQQALAAVTTKVDELQRKLDSLPVLRAV